MKNFDFVLSIINRYRLKHFLPGQQMQDQIADPASQDTAAAQTSRQRLAQSHAIDRRVPGESTADNQGAAATSVTTLEAALEILARHPQAMPSGEDRQRLQHAFEIVHACLERCDIVQRPLTCMPLLMPVARRLSRLANLKQTEQGLGLLEKTLHAYPDLILAHALATQLPELRGDLQQRTLAILEDVLAKTGNLPQAHVDILVELTRSLHRPGCRERISAMLQTGLAQLRHEPALTGEIRLAMITVFNRSATELSLVA